MQFKLFARHPRTLRYWLLSEFTERLCFFTIRAILSIVMIRSLHLSEEVSILTVAMFMSYCYITPLIGGFIADRWMQYEHAVLLGSLLMSVGYFIIGLPHDRDIALGLAVIITGIGFYKTNLVTCISRLYEDDQAHLGEAFTIFYAVVSISLLITTGLLSWTAAYSWRITFLGLACISLISTIFIAFKLRISETLSLSALFSFKTLLIGLCIATQISAFLILLSSPRESHSVLWIIFTLLMSYYGWIAYHCKMQDLKKISIIFFFTLLGILFFSCVEQIGFSILLYIEHHVDRIIFNDYTIPSPFFMILEPVGFILFCPLLYRYFQKQESFFLTKIASGFFIAACGFGLLAFITYPFHTEGNYFSIGLTILLLAMSEILVLPTLLQLTTQLAPKSITSITVSLPFLSYALATDLAAYLSKLSLIETSNSALSEPPVHNYFNLFLGITMMTGLIALGLFCLRKITSGGPRTANIAL